MYITHSILFLCLFSFSISFSNEYLINNTYELSEYPRIIWSYYVGEMPPYIREMFDITVGTLNDTWKYYYLTNENISEFLDTTFLPSHFSLLLPQHQSDLIRLALLEKYGGWWMDNGIIVNSQSEIERIYDKIVENRAEFYGTCVFECPLKDVETCFMYARKGSELIKKWLYEMMEVYKIGEANYIYKVYREGVNVPRISFVGYPKVNPYMVIFAAFEKSKFRDTSRNLSIIIEPADEVLYTMHNYVKKNNKRYKEVYFNEELRRQFPIIKLGGWLRVKIFKEKRISGFESYEPIPVQEGSKGGLEIGKRMFQYLIILVLINFMFILLLYNKWMSLLINRCLHNSLIK